MNVSTILLDKEVKEKLKNEKAKLEQKIGKKMSMNDFLKVVKFEY
ncbi:MAG: hypothetical protein QXS90_02220 [Candidatus Diapherotrites archaeon]